MKQSIRKQAKELGLKKYFTGTPCKHGHIAERITANGCCTECVKISRKANYDSERHKEYMREYYQLNKERLLQYTSEYYKEHSVHLKQWIAQYRLDNIQYYLEYGRRYYTNNVEYFKKHTADWYVKNIDKIRQYWKDNAGRYNANSAKRRCAIKQAIPKWADLEAIEDVYEESIRLSAETGKLYNVDHIVPLQNEKVCGLHCEDNLQIITEKENKEKSNNFEV